MEDQAHSTYATEFASKIMKKILPFLGIYAENTDDASKADSTAEPTAEPAATQKPADDPEPTAEEEPTAAPEGGEQ